MRKQKVKKISLSKKTAAKLKEAVLLSIRKKLAS